jgi:hypothetical protein
MIVVLFVLVTLLLQQLLVLQHYQLPSATKAQKIPEEGGNFKLPVVPPPTATDNARMRA